MLIIPFPIHSACRKSRVLACLATASFAAASLAMPSPLAAAQEVAKQPSTTPVLQPVKMPEKTLVEGGGGMRELEAGGHVTVNHAKITFQAGDTLIEVPKDTAASIEMTPAEGAFDAEGFTRMVCELKNDGAAEVKYELRLENEGASEAFKNVHFFGWITPGESKKSNVFFPRSKEVREKYPELAVFGRMKGLPGGLVFDQEHSINPGKIVKIRMTVFPCAEEVKLTLGRVYASHPPVPPLLAKNPQYYFPFIDAYGQFMHDDWPGKVKNDADLKAATVQEEKDLKAYPGPAGRSKFGGWTKGPQLKATGFFRTEKYKGKWWLVDPEGWLFWSNGVTCVGLGGADTLVAGRAHFFTGLPDAKSPLAQFYTKGGSVFMFTQSNLYRKYGADWANLYRDVTQRRLISWGLNTMGNWSNPLMTNMRKLPYVVPVDFKCKTVTWRKFPDVFSPSFRVNMREAFEARSDAFNDPWCLGFFVQNELKFSSPVKFMGDVCGEGASEPCKIEWIKDLKNTYPTIEKFNQEAGTAFPSWNALSANNKPVKLDKIPDVAAAFYKKMCAIYFQTCREEEKRVAPNQLYLGCRFLQNVTEAPVAVAACYCDVVSYNVYDYKIGTRNVEQFDKPFLIGEFHFGSLDRGMFGPGCTWAGDQQDRAGMYKDYVTGGLKDPYCVGAHWFQYNSQAFTGRTDGEDYQVGLVDITGNPYPELRNAMRETGCEMYETRLNAK